MWKRFGVWLLKTVIEQVVTDLGKEKQKETK